MGRGEPGAPIIAAGDFAPKRRATECVTSDYSRDTFASSRQKSVDE